MGRDQLRAVIDRLVEESIRRILPGVMNEVLLKTIVGSGVLTEARRPNVATQPKPRATSPTSVPTSAGARSRPDLAGLLDDSVGADAYQQYEGRGSRPSSPDWEPVEETDGVDHDRVPLTERIKTLDPVLQEMAQGMDLSDDGIGEMWDEGEHDSFAVVPDLPPVNDITSAARKVGIDFSRMANTINRTAPVIKSDQSDVRARAQFEERRLKNMRERLNDGKPLD